MASKLEELGEAAGRMASAAARYPGIASRAARMADRLAHGRFHVSVLGEFKRGKSTLINALVGADVLPTGVLPLTAVATEVAFGDPGATVVHLDGSERAIGLDQMPDFVTEGSNPNNEKQVARVEVRVRAALLEPGLVLVDTPGIGSIYRHNTDVARRAVVDADGAILVFSADAPLSQHERELLAEVGERQAPTFFLLNKADHLAPGELYDVRRFVSDVMAAELGRKERVWCVAARPALAAARAGQPPGPEAGELGGFLAALDRFVERDLVEARLATARREVARLGRDLADVLAMEASALDVDAQTLAARVEDFRTAAAHQRQAFTDERTLLARDVAALVRSITEDLQEFARREPANWQARLEAVARTARPAELEEALRAQVERAVHEGFESFRQRTAQGAEESWQRLAERFRARTQARVNEIRAAAADLFAVSLPEVTVPAVAEERERFFYLFLHVGTSGETLDHWARRLLPAAVVRRRLSERARRHLLEEFDKHAGRARWDLSQRLEAVRLRFEVAMREELDRAIDSILEAADRAEGRRRQTQAEQARRLTDDEEARAAARLALSLAGSGP
ncbi:MAG: dynamin family protein [Acidimicrobiales bacterium]